MPSVVIFGAGIAGLTAAHYLAREKGYQVTLIELLNVPGGLARSERDPVDKLPTEYSYRGMGPWYHNFFNLMQDVPTAKDSTVFETELSQPIRFLLAHDKSKTSESLKSVELDGQDKIAVEGDFYQRLRLSWWDKAATIYLFAKTWCASDARSQNEYTKMNASEVLQKYLSPRAAHAMSQLFGPWVGTDSSRASLHHVAAFFRKNLMPGPPAPYFHKGPPAFYQGDGSGWLFFNNAINESIFDPIVNELRSLGAKVMFNCKLYRLIWDSTENRITGAEVIPTTLSNDGSAAATATTVIAADYYVLAINPYETYTVLQRSPELLASDRQLQQFEHLVADTAHAQVSFRIAFTRKIKMCQRPVRVSPAIILLDSEYDITLFAPDELWKNSAYFGDGVQSLWSGTATLDQTRGALYDLPLTELTKQQFIDEIMHQIYRCQDLIEMVAEYNDGLALQEVPVKRVEVWKTWIFDGSKLQNSEKKWVNNSRNWEYQPSAVTSVPNLLLAGAHTKTNADLYSMEAAAESGRRVYDIVTDSNTVIPQHTNFILRIMKAIDAVFYQWLSLPNIIDVVIMIVVVVLLVAVIPKILSWSYGLKYNKTF